MVSMEKNSPKISWIKRSLSWSSVETSTRRWSLKSWARTVMLPSLYSPACNIWTMEWQISVFYYSSFQWRELIHFNLDWSNNKLSLTFDNYLQITLLLDPFPVVAADQVCRVRGIELQELTHPVGGVVSTVHIIGFGWRADSPTIHIYVVVILENQGV